MIMNNDYDRETLAENVTITVDAGAESAVKLVIMQSGTQVIAEVSEPMYGDYYILKDPRTVSLQVTTEGGQEVIESISYSAWAPLSADETFHVGKGAIASVCNAIESLEQSYRGVTA